MRWFSGTSGYSYKEWKGPFYPEDLGADSMLEYYAKKLPAVEINNTFYRMPTSSVLASWAAAVPTGFRFVIKASKRITHEQRLIDTADSTNYLMHKLDVLEDRLGAVLFQLPPYLRKDMQRLNTFLATLPEALPSAIEFRHDTWLDDEVFDTLARRNVAICVSDDGESVLPARIATTRWLYLRLRQQTYNDAALRAWVEHAQSTAANTGYVFFKHEDDGAGPALATRFLDLAAGAESTGAAVPAARPAKRPRRATSTRTKKPARKEA